jgi:signal transduction histidine kinase
VDELERLKLDALKELAYGASHEINNPLANIAARAQTLLRDESHPERRRALEAIHQQAIRAHEMISDLMLFARPPALALETVDLGSLLEQVVASVSKGAESREISVQLTPTAGVLSIVADPEQLHVAIKAVVTNAIEAIGREGRVDITAREEVLVGRKSTVIEIRDNGSGISAEVREHIFDPFYSGREAGRGLGFGLSKCWRIITEHGGDIVVNSAPGQGATFTIYMPCSQTETQVIAEGGSPR